MEIVGLSYGNQLLAYSLGLYHFLQTRDYSNLTRDECVLCRMISIGLYNDEDSMNNLGARRAMMHGVVMADRLWELIRAMCKWVSVGVPGMTLFVTDSFTRAIVWNKS